MKPVLVDTSIWIDFFRKKAFFSQIETLAGEGRIATCGLVRAELLPFIRKERKSVEDYFQQMIYFGFQDEFWLSLISFREKLLTRGFDLSIPDLILTTLCKHHDAPLFTKDRDFSRITKILDLELF